MKKLFIIALSLAVCLSLAAVVSAETTTGSMNVMAEVDVTCIMNVGNMNFGQYSGDPLGANATVDVQCTSGTLYSMTFDVGQNAVGILRRMTSEPPGDYLGYQLLCPADPSEPPEAECGDGTTFGIAPIGTGTGNTQTFDIEGSIPGGQFAPAGEYHDNVVVTLTFN